MGRSRSPPRAFRAGVLGDEVTLEEPGALEVVAAGARMVRFRPVPTGSEGLTLGGDRPEALGDKVLPVGGIKEKVLAAHRAGIRTVILPRWNERDLEDVPDELRRQLSFVFVDDAEEVLRQALAPVAGEVPGAARGGG